MECKEKELIERIEKIIKRFPKQGENIDLDFIEKNIKKIEDSSSKI